MRKLLLAAALLWAVPANSATMTFTGLPRDLFIPANQTWTEDGITANTPYQFLGSYGRPNTAHLTDGGSAYTGILNFTMGGTLFSAQSVDILPYSFPSLGTASFTAIWYTVNPDWNGIDNDRYIEHRQTVRYDNILLEGYRNGALVAQDTINQFVAAPLYLFDPAFSGIDQLRITALAVDFANNGGFSFPSDAVNENSYFSLIDATCAPCASFDIDNVRLAPVPLPGGLLLFGSVLGLTVLTNRWRRRRVGR